MIMTSWSRECSSEDLLAVVKEGQATNRLSPEDVEAETSGTHQQKIWFQITQNDKVYDHWWNSSGGTRINDPLIISLS